MILVKIFLLPPECLILEKPTMYLNNTIKPKLFEWESKKI